MSNYRTDSTRTAEARAESRYRKTIRRDRRTERRYADRSLRRLIDNHR